MKKMVSVWFSEEEFKQLEKEAARKGVSVYSLVKHRVLSFKRIITLYYIMAVCSACLSAITIWILLSLYGIIGSL
ncbi:MAG: hypothetical protein QW175_01700 [Candidatus Bathyarchaeia archaeon]